MADGGEQSTKVVHGTEEDAAEDNPQENGNPAEYCGLDRSVNGACAGDGREMVAHQNGGVCGNKVLSVVTGVRGGFVVGVDAPLFCQPATVEYVAQSEQNNCDDQDKNCAHTFHSLNKMCNITILSQVSLS